MKVRLFPKISYEVEIDGVKIPGVFSDDGMWNGMRCVKGEGGKIVLSEDSMIDFHCIATGIPAAKVGKLISASPSILSFLAIKKEA